MIRKMAVWRILRLGSVESGGYYLTNRTAADVIYGGVLYEPETGKLAEDMQKNGQKYPVLVARCEDIAHHYGVDSLGYEDVQMLGDGHHRVAAALSLCWSEMDVTDDPAETGRYREDWWTVHQHD